VGNENQDPDVRTAEKDPSAEGAACDDLAAQVTALKADRERLAADKAELNDLDDFDRALNVETADANYAKGVGLIYIRMYETLKKMGLEPMDTVGKTFDPNQHQAVERVETDEADDQTILAEFQKGYTFKGKLLRPAMVKVAVRPS
jgi:molecular chaperone GrpE (heat shock protein)